MNGNDDWSVLVFLGIVLAVIYGITYSHEEQIELVHKGYKTCYTLDKAKTSTSSHATRFTGEHKYLDGLLHCYDEHGSLYPAPQKINEEDQL